jgi:hypothetical protein
MERVTHSSTCAARCNVLSTVLSMAWAALLYGRWRPPGMLHNMSQLMAQRVSAPLVGR